MNDSENPSPKGKFNEELMVKNRNTNNIESKKNANIQFIMQKAGGDHVKK